MRGGGGCAGKEERRGEVCGGETENGDVM